MKEANSSQFKHLTEASNQANAVRLPRIESQQEINSIDDESRIESCLLSYQANPSFSQDFYQNQRNKN